MRFPWCYGLPFFLWSVACGQTASNSVRCGDGTQLSGSTCVPASDSGPGQPDANAGTDASARSDAGPSDGAAKGEAAVDFDGGMVVPIDWSNMRGSPVQTTSVGTFTGQLFAVTDTGVVLQGGSGCSDSSLSVSVCDYTWLDDQGSPSVTVPSMTTYAAASVSDDAKYLALIDGSEVSMCSIGAQITGSAALFDLATGVSLWQGPSGTMPAYQMNEAFSSRSDWFAAPEATPGGIPCPTGSISEFSLGAPLGTPSAVPFQGVELPDGRWFVSQSAGGAAVDALGLATPTSASTFAPFATGAFFSPLAIYGRNGWLHVSSYTDSTGAGAQLTSFEFSGTQSMATTFVGTAGLFALSVSGRWALFCVNTAETTQSCVVHDASGQVADAAFQNVTLVPPALAGQANLLVYAPVGGTTLTARELSTGTEVTTPILATKATLQVMGNEAMVIALTSSSVAWAVAPSGWEELATGVENTWMLPAGGFFGDPAGTASGAENLLLITHDSGAGNVALDVWDASTGALVTLSDRIAYSSVTSGEDCLQPAIVYSAGLSVERGLQSAQYLFFAELSATDSTKATLFLMPIDRSSPPRALAVTPVTDCRAPLVSSSGARVGVWLHHAATAGDAISVGSL